MGLLCPEPVGAHRKRSSVGLDAAGSPAPGWVHPLTVDPGVVAGSGRAVRAVRRALSPRVQALLERGDVTGMYSSRSEVALAVALGAVNAGWSRAELRAAFDDPGHVAGEWLHVQQRAAKHGGGQRVRSGLDQDHRLDAVWRKAVVRFFARPPAADVCAVAAEIAEIRAAMDARPQLWGGQAGKGNRQTLDALLEVAGRAGRLDPTVSIRQLAEQTTVTDSTVDRAVHRLVEAGWIRIVEVAGFTLVGMEDPDGVRAGQAHARRLQVRIPPDLPDPVDIDVLVDPATGELPPAGGSAVAVHDVFTWRGLGGVAGLLYARLDPACPVSTRLLAARSGFTPVTVRTHLRRLTAYGLACHTSGAGWTRGAGDLDAVAVEVGTAGTLARRAEQYAVDRAAYIAWATQHENRRGWRAERGLLYPRQRSLGFAVPGQIPPSRGRPQAATAA